MPKDDKDRYPFLVKIAGTVAALGAAWLAHKVVDQVWKATTGHPVPSEKSERDTALPQAIAAATITAAVGAAVRVAAQRGGTKVARRIVG